MKWRQDGHLSILDFDTESLAAGFADPAWVPQAVTCCAWSWIGDDHVDVTICGFDGFFVPKVRARTILPLVEAIRSADMVTGHNLWRHDLPLLQSECKRLKLGSLGSVLVQDTMWQGKTKGFKKGQDNLARLLRVNDEKLSLDWQAWWDAYAEKGWPIVKERCVSDVIQHKAMREAMLAEGWLKAPRRWYP